MVIETRNLTKTFNRAVVAVTGLDLMVSRGTVFGLMGRNGAGKTTTLRLLMGLLRPDAGSARVLGEDLWRAPRSARQRIAYVSQAQQLPGWMTLADCSRYHSFYYNGWSAEYARQLAHRWDLPWTRPVGTLSGGEQRQAAIILALAARPEVLLLDEPAANLDPISRRALLNGMVEAISEREECTIVFSTHAITDLERVADHIGIMDRGRLVTTVVLAELLETTKRVQVVFNEAGPPDGFLIPGVLCSHTAGPVVTAIVRLASESQLDLVRQLPGARVNVFPMNLEEIFIELLGRQTGHDLTKTNPADSLPQLMVWDKN